MRLAHKEGQTQGSFQSWVDGYGSLSAILRKIWNEGIENEVQLPSQKKRIEASYGVGVRY